MLYLLSLVCVAAGYNVEFTPTVAKLVREQVTSLSKVASYELEGFVEITHSDFVMGENVEENKIQTHRFHVWGAGSSLKVRYDRLDDGHVGESKLFYNDAEKVVSFNTADGIANIAKRKRSKRRLGLRNRSPAFMEYSFLQPWMDNSGIQAVSPEQLRDTKGWGILANDLKVETNPRLRLKFSREDGFTVAEFDESPFDRSKLFPRTSEFYTKTGALLSTIHVLEVAADPVLGTRPKKMKLTVFWPTANGYTSIPVATWVFQIEAFTVNGKIDEVDIMFDPLSADTIWDSDNKTWIKVPR